MMAASSFASLISRVTDCSNPVFQPVINKAWGDASMQQDVLSVLTAITKIIHDVGGTESSSEYYAALLTALKRPSSTKAAEAFLLKRVMCKAVPDPLMRKSCGEAAKILMSLLKSYSGDASLVKSVLTCLGRLLRAQSYECWSTESVRHVYRQLLSYVDDDKPSIRRSCHIAVVDVLSAQSSDDSSQSHHFHPACHQTAEYLCSVIRQEIAQLLAVLHTKDVQCTKLLHFMDLLARILHLLPAKNVKNACECILETVSFPNSLVATKAFQSLQHLFEERPSLDSLAVPMVGRLLTALHGSRPQNPTVFAMRASSSSASSLGFTGLDVLVAWLKAIRFGCGHLCSLLAAGTRGSDGTSLGGGSADLSPLVGEHLEHLFKVSLELLTETPLPRLRKSVADLLDSVIMEELNTYISSQPDTASCQLLSHIASRLVNCLELKHFETWQQALVLGSRLLHIWPQSAVIDPSVVTLIHRAARLRDSLVDGPASLTSLIRLESGAGGGGGLLSQDDTRLAGEVGEAIVDELDRFCLVALEVYGLENVLGGTDDVLPLDPLINELESGSVDLRRSWLLLLLARAKPTRPGRLAFFSKYLLPLVDRALSVARRAASEVMPASAALVTASITVARQLWTGLASTVHSVAPTDWQELSSGQLGRRLVKELASASALRPTILLALRRLANLAVSASDGGDVSANKTETGLITMRGGAKLIIPTLLQLYETNANDVKQASLVQQLRTTLDAYILCLTPKMIAAPTALAFQKLTSTSNPVYMELLQMLIPHSTVDEIVAFLPKLTNYLLSASRPSWVLQKRAYRLVQLIYMGSTPPAREFLADNLDQTVAWFHQLTQQDEGHKDCPENGQSSVVVACQKRSKQQKRKFPWKPRIRCIYHLLSHLVSAIHKGNEAEEAKKDWLNSPRLRHFANLFMPEILIGAGVANQMVRDISCRLIVCLVMAFSGQPLAPPTSKNPRPFLKRLDDHDDYDDDATTVRDDVTASGGEFVDKDDLDDVEDDETVASQMDDGLSASGPYRCATDMLIHQPPPNYHKVCLAAELVVSGLWCCLPPHVPPATASSPPGDLASQEAAARVACHLLADARIRLALRCTLRRDDNPVVEDDDSPHRGVCLMLGNAVTAVKHLTASPHRLLARCGLRMVRLLLAFVHCGRVSLPDLVEIVQSLNPNQKRPLRFAVKSVLEKMIQKFGRKTIQGMCNSEYQKVVRNSARVMARREQRLLQKSNDLAEAGDNGNDEEEASSGAEDGQMDTLSRKSHQSKSSDTRSVATSSRSLTSLPARVHLPRIGELLADSSDDDDKQQPSSSAYPETASSVASGRSKRSGLSQRQSLADEMQLLADTSGLSRRSQKRVLLSRGGGDGDGDGDMDEDDGRSAFTSGTGIRRKVVRFADSASCASTARLQSRSTIKGVRSTAKGASGEDHLWLIERPGTVLDLSDPQALARHMALAKNVETAQAMAEAMRLTEKPGVSSSSSSFGLSRSSPFPIVDGKLVIGAVGNPEVVGQSAGGDDLNWCMPASDGEDVDEARTHSSWTATSLKRQRQTRREQSQQRSAPALPGSEYASRKARGDMKRRGQPDPFAYLELGAGLAAKGTATTSLERQKLLKAVGIGKQKRKRLDGRKKPVIGKSMTSQPRRSKLSSRRRKP